MIKNFAVWNRTSNQSGVARRAAALSLRRLDRLYMASYQPSAITRKKNKGKRWRWSYGSLQYLSAAGGSGQTQAQVWN